MHHQTMNTQSSGTMTRAIFILALLTGIGWLAYNFTFSEVYDTFRVSLNANNMISKKSFNFPSGRQWGVSLNSTRSEHFLSKRCLTLFKPKWKGPKGKPVPQIEESPKMCTKNQNKGKSKDEIQESSSKIKTLENESSRPSPRYIGNEATSLHINGNDVQLPNNSPRANKGKGKATHEFKQNWPRGSLHELKSPTRYDEDLRTGILRSASDSRVPLDPYDTFQNPYPISYKSPMRTFPERELEFKKGSTIPSPRISPWISPELIPYHRSYSQNSM